MEKHGFQCSADCGNPFACFCAVGRHYTVGACTGRGADGNAHRTCFGNPNTASRLTARTLGNGLTQTFTYHPWTTQGGRLQTLATGSLQNLTYAYDALDRLTSWTLNGSPQETYAYDPASGNLTVKGARTLAYTDPNHAHAVTSAGGNSYQYDANGNQTTRVIGSDTFTLLYDADIVPAGENRLVEVKKNGVTLAQFVYDGDGNRVKSVLNGETTYFIGSYYERKGSQVTKYYFAGTSRIAMRKYTIPQSMTVEYLLGDHLGSTTITTDADGAKVSEIRYKPWGEIRYAWTSNPSTTPAYTLPTYTYTGQYSDSYINLLWYGSRHYDPALGRFIQPDSIVPLASQGVQAWDRFGYANNNPVRYTDPTGHSIDCAVGEYGCRAGRLTPRARVFYLNGLGGEGNQYLTPRLDPENEYNSSMYWISQAVGNDNLIHVPLFTNPHQTGVSHLEMLGEAFGLSDHWTNEALGAIRSELESNPLGNDEKLVIVGSSAGGTVAVELLDDLAGDGIFVDQLILRGSPVIELELTNVGRVDYITAEIPLTDWKWYSIDVNPFDAVQVQEHCIPGLVGHVPHGTEMMNKIGSLIVDLISR